jgi:hypothetical protein
MEETMRQVLILSVAATLAIASASAQAPKTEFYVDWNPTTKKCFVVTAKPTDKTVFGGGPFKTREEAEAAIKAKTIMGC